MSTEIKCPICNGNQFQKMGIRGTREYSGADPNFKPHITTNVLQCIHCSFFISHPDIEVTTQISSEHYNDADEYHSAPIEKFQSRIDLLRKHQQNGHVLDIGAGKGEFMKVLKDSGFSVSGIEPSAQFCKYAQDHFGLQIHTGYLSTVTLPAHTYNVVSMIHVLEHVETPISTLKHIHQLLVPGGIFLVEVPNCNSWLAKLIDFIFRIRGRNWSSRLSPFHPPYHKYGHTIQSLRTLLHATGFDILEAITFSGTDRESMETTTNQSLLSSIRKISMSITNLFGNKELLCIVARSKV